MSKPAKKTNFGYQEVDIDKKASMVKEVFSAVAPKYDLMNNAMSFGVHHLWKDQLLLLMPNSKAKLLDVAGGTGDISFRFIEKAKKHGNTPDITVCDINPEMLEHGKIKALNKNITSGIDFVHGDAEDLPFPDNHFDYYTIAFGIRNVTNIQKALDEAYRVLKPTGKFLCLEFSHVNNAIIKSLYDFYSFAIIPQIGKVVASNKDAYQYLVESIRNFPNQAEFAHMIEKAGFSRVRYNNLSFGITAIHTAYKIC